MADAKTLTILYIGPLMLGGTCLQRLWAFDDLGHNVIGVESGVPDGLSSPRRFLYRARRKLFPTITSSQMNRHVLSVARDIRPTMVWIDKGLIIGPQTLLEIKRLCPKAPIVSFSPDDMMNPHNQSPDYLNSIALYDYHVTTKSYNVAELKALGARDVIMMDNGFCRRSHVPVPVTAEQRASRGGPVGFIGFWEKEREEYLTFLARQGVALRIWGGWKKSPNFPSNMRIEKGVAWGDDYAATLSSFDINIGFLRKENRDLQTTRSIEIPACGSMMIAERTDEHLSLFREGEEAEFFESKEELHDKVVYYLRHEDRRREVAQAGYRRCIEGGYSYTERLRSVLKKIERGTA